MHAHVCVCACAYLVNLGSQTTISHGLSADLARFALSFHLSLKHLHKQALLQTEFLELFVVKHNTDSILCQSYLVSLNAEKITGSRECWEHRLLCGERIKAMPFLLVLRRGGRGAAAT